MFMFMCFMHWGCLRICIIFSLIISGVGWWVCGGEVRILCFGCLVLCIIGVSLCGFWGDGFCGVCIGFMCCWENMLFSLYQYNRFFFVLT